MSGVSDLKAVLRIRPFRRLWLVLGLSATGDWLGLLAMSLFAASQFDNTTAQGAAFSLVIVVRLIPSLLLGPLAGVFADRWDRRITMAVCDTLRFALFASVPLVAMWTGVGVKAAGWTAIATFLIEAVGMMWMPAKEAAVPNLLPRSRLEAANQLTLVTTYGFAPVIAAGVMSVLEANWMAGALGEVGDWAAPAAIGLYLNALTFLAAAAVVFFRIPEISVRRNEPGQAPKEQRGMLRDFADGWRHMGRNKMVRGLVLGILGAFAGAGVIIGTGQFFARSLGGGEAAFTVLFATVFVGLGLGIVAGPALVGQLSRRRWFGMSIVVGGFGLLVDGLAPHLWVAIVGTLIVGAGAGMAFLSGITLLGREVEDTVRGRMFAFISTSARVVLMVTISAASVIGGYGSARQVDIGPLTFDFSFGRILLLIAAVVGVLTGYIAFRQMDDKPGVPVIKDLWGSMRGRPLVHESPAGGTFVVFEGGEGSGKSTQAVKLAAWLRQRGHEVVLTREPGATELGVRIRTLLLDPESGTSPSPRTEALLYAADRAQHVSKVVRPALDRGAVVISDRYVDSSLAYQGSGRELPADEVAWLSHWATGGLKPDLVVLLDIDPRVGLVRATKGSAGDRLEQEALTFHEAVREKFRDLAADDSSRYLVVDATQSPEDIAAKVSERVAAVVPPVPGETADDDDPNPPMDAHAEDKTVKFAPGKATL
ncbi:dTMP kinase [Stackebrandtia nassauensis]|uniref:Thymidylate kinase n=1 Tax=Stackebrandtia nassauensis (strain DSM 44728 / CIP 108903 / NRRL B-16338 / NBRC 102104 / LLR-40K-21) TaxID=446470 RepID=D3Q851_STANL|nr:dTMP kinase [Stackebrandtia nassauensis]ADD40556.1 thymidylate kinase [Stackebrandtia nassauensis DSM 44728]